MSRAKSRTLYYARGTVYLRQVERPSPPVSIFDADVAGKEDDVLRNDWLWTLPEGASTHPEGLELRCAALNLQAPSHILPRFPEWFLLREHLLGCFVSDFPKAGFLTGPPDSRIPMTTRLRIGLGRKHACADISRGRNFCRSVSGRQRVRGRSVCETARRLCGKSLTQHCRRGTKISRCALFSGCPGWDYQQRR